MYVSRLTLGRVRLGIFRNKNVLRNIFRLLCSWEQNSQNGIKVFRNENSSQTNAYLHYSNYSYSGLIPDERALRVTRASDEEQSDPAGRSLVKSCLHAARDFVEMLQWITKIHLST